MALRKFAYLSPSKVEGETSLPWEFIMTVQHSGKFGTGLTMSVLQEECCCSVVQSCLIPCDPMDCSMPGFPVLYHLLKLAQTHVHWVNDAIQSSLPLLSPSPPAFYLSQNQDPFQWVSSSHQVAKVLELQLQNQSFQWIFRVDFLYDWVVWFPCSPRNSQDSSPTPQFESINSSVPNLLYGPTLTSIHDYWENHSFD